MANTIITKNSSTASAIPSAGSLTQGELAVNVTDKKLYTKDSGGDVVEITPTNATNATNATNVTGTTTAAVPTSALASGTANSTTFLRGDRTWVVVDSSPSFLTGVTAGTNYNLASSGDFSTSSSSLQRGLQSKMLCSGTVRVAWGQKSASSDPSDARVYKNGVVVSGDITQSTNTSGTKTYDLSVAYGNTVEIYIRTRYGSGTSYIAGATIGLSVMSPILVHTGFRNDSTNAFNVAPI